MHCNLRQPDAAQSLPALISSPMPSLKSLSLSIAVLGRFTANTLHYAVTLNFDSVILTSDHWPWTFVVCQLCHDQTLYQIWAKWSNPRRTYCTARRRAAPSCNAFAIATFSSYKKAISQDMDLLSCQLCTLVRHRVTQPYNRPRVFLQGRFVKCA